MADRVRRRDGDEDAGRHPGRRDRGVRSWPALAILVGSAQARHQAREIEAQARERGLLSELIAGIGTIKAAGAERQALERWLRRFRTELSHALRRQRLGLWSDVGLETLRQGALRGAAHLGREPDAARRAARRDAPRLRPAQLRVPRGGLRARPRPSHARGPPAAARQDPGDPEGRAGAPDDAPRGLRGALRAGGDGGRLVPSRTGRPRGSRRATPGASRPARRRSSPAPPASGRARSCACSRGSTSRRRGRSASAG